ncbi:MAG: ABC transporter substrate-binding protein [Gammaproteobacteria bacterium]|nr:ABC transporter substrate-binding protein [Gammaproteobacteria bacterium]NIR83928.1 ABC transporter substrate-binding protein [Gammaproteobacteria bacterium]NIR88923.1 ABC transporter substrate-binding protein [Gammaproteobacteria bacterium]NIU04139.1 ABC transporter substrate-binding protein [Gammaproteobacteria bacterium]NIV74154.1 ABC transporter substrate-binding protein [Gammaproteobacteria bacterium]
MSTLQGIGSSLRSAVVSFALAGPLVLALAVLGVAPAQAATYTMVIGHLYPDDITNNEQAAALERFRQIVETATGGDIDVQVFGGGALGSEVEMGKQAQKGKTIQSVLMSSGANSSFFKEYQLVTTPFLFPNYKVAWEFFDSDYFANFMRGEMEQSGLRYLGTFDDGGGFVAFTNNKRVIKTVDDIKGLKIRVEENPAHMAVMKSLGASPTPLPWGEVHTALATGLADGQFNAPGTNDIFNLAEVTNYTTWSGHVYNTITWVVSDQWFSQLPGKYQKIIVQAAREAVHMGHGIATQITVIGWVNSCKRFKECYILPDEEKEKMKAIAQPAFKKWITEDFGIDPALVEEFWAAVDDLQTNLDASWEKKYLY